MLRSRLSTTPCSAHVQHGLQPGVIALLLPPVALLSRKHSHDWAREVAPRVRLSPDTEAHHDPPTHNMPGPFFPKQCLGGIMQSPHLLVERGPGGAHAPAGPARHVVGVGRHLMRAPGGPQEVGQAGDALRHGLPQRGVPAVHQRPGQARRPGRRPPQLPCAGAPGPLRERACSAYLSVNAGRSMSSGCAGAVEDPAVRKLKWKRERQHPAWRAARTSGAAGQAAMMWRSRCTQRSTSPLRCRRMTRGPQPRPGSPRTQLTMRNSCRARTST